MQDQGRMEDFQVNIQEINNILKTLDGRRAMGPDGVSGWILKECRDELKDKLHSTYSSINHGTVPQDWKRADIVPLFKGGNAQNPSYYRPVSLTSVVAKICERIMKDKWTKFLEDNRILTNCQFGFRKGRSCITNLLCYYSRVIDTIRHLSRSKESV